ncbi:unnamed protein product [Acanthoscelides obtectus]|uniref:Actin-related protein 2/3 complex subunit 5 n=1 Tax=Acanthoscelides obtectus TaxID=200917 RepID=A0A9P0L7L3_ACAOB|nr:unnamed protein product [Acanthoscelides obtectus]CAK1637985.1 Actin-related protein 2/3 complex subunit 5 [Acanthoscelides obtectus]
MAKNTRSSAFRKIDVDQYSEDNYKEDEPDSGPTLGPDENEVNVLLQKGKLLDALRTVLVNAPVGVKNPQVKENALALALKVILSIKTSQIDDILNALDRELLDTLMKYVYKGFENPSEGSSGHLLLWHEKIYNIAGVGCIVRVLADRRRV